MEEISTLHKDIVKDDQYLKNRHINLHNFPTFGINTQGIIECKPEMKFRRFNESETLNELTVRKYDCISYEEMYQKEIDEAEKIGFDKGYQKGINDGSLTGKKEIEPVLNKLIKAINEIQIIKLNLSRNIEVEAVNLSLAIAKKIVGNEISINKKIIVNVVKEALKKVDGHEDIKIKVNPEEMKMLEDNKIELKKIANYVQELQIVGDAHITPGGCIVETNIGDIDARIEKQFKVIEDAFKLDCL